MRAGEPNSARQDGASGRIDMQSHHLTGDIDHFDFIKPAPPLLLQLHLQDLARVLGLDLRQHLVEGEDLAGLNRLPCTVLIAMRPDLGAHRQQQHHQND